MVLAMPLTRPTLQVSNPVPLYEQIARHITQLVADGTMAPGERIPSGRFLAEDWEVGYSTVQHAMNVLVERGVIVTSQGKGTFVAEPTGQ